MCSRIFFQQCSPCPGPVVLPGPGPGNPPNPARKAPGTKRSAQITSGCVTRFDLHNLDRRVTCHYRATISLRTRKGNRMGYVPQCSLLEKITNAIEDSRVTSVCKCLASVKVQRRFSIRLRTNSGTVEHLFRIPSVPPGHRISRRNRISKNNGENIKKHDKKRIELKN